MEQAVLEEAPQLVQRDGQQVEPEDAKQRRGLHRSGWSGSLCGAGRQNSSAASVWPGPAHAQPARAERGLCGGADLHAREDPLLWARGQGG